VSASATVSVWHYVKPAVSRKIDSGLFFLLPAVLCHSRSGHWWYSWARWSTVIQSSSVVLKEYSVHTCLPSVRATSPNSGRCR